MKHFNLNDQPDELLMGQSALSNRLTSCPDQRCYDITYEGRALRIKEREKGIKTLWFLFIQSDQLRLEWAGSSSEYPETTELLAAIEAAVVNYPHQQKISLQVPGGEIQTLFDSDVLIKNENNQLVVYVDAFWQQAGVWCSAKSAQVFPIHYVFSQGRSHPLRPPKPVGKVYQRYIPWLGRTLAFRVIDAETDLRRFNRWMNDPVVANFWQEEGDMSKHLDYLAAIEADPHVIGLIGCFDDEPFGYFEIYWAKEDRLSPYYDVNDFDRGWHVLIGESHMRGKPFVTAWLPSISHYLFLDDDRTQRLVIEPRIDNNKMIRNLEKCGYVNIKEFDFPHKRAVLGMLSRERFFAEQRWVPRHVAPPQSVSMF